MEPLEKKNFSGDEEPIVHCRSCGAEFSSALPNCPYCGTMYLPAAEKAYMSRLEDVRSDLEQLSDLPAAESRHHFSRLTRRLLIAAAALFIIVMVWQTVRTRVEQHDAAAEKAETLWQRDGFARMDEAWSSGDYETLLSLYIEASDAGHSVYAYKHANFCRYLQQLKDTDSALNEVENREGHLSWLLLNELELYTLEDLRDLTPEERTILEDSRRPYLEDLQQRFSLSEEELQFFRDRLHTDGWLSYDECRRFLEEKGVQP